MTGATQILVNAVIVSATRETAAGAAEHPGREVYRAGRQGAADARSRGRSDERAGGMERASAGKSQAGAGIKIGIIDSGIDQNHAGFQDPSLQPRRAFPKGDAAYTNSKVIVARSYVQKDLAPGYAYDPSIASWRPRRSRTTTRRATAWGTARPSR